MALVGATTELGVVVAALAAGGWWLDGKLGTSPWLMLVGLAVGLIGETYKLWRLGRRFFR
jgi:F0F1-type ATP synthase assembly protein I